MSYQDFLKMYASDVKSTPEELIALSPTPFAVSTNSRGERLVEVLSRRIHYDFGGKRVLDVGCAYGGLSLACAAVGARVSGIDVSQRFIEYAQANSKNVADIDLHRVDASSKKLRTLFTQSEFDFAIINDVLEHIYDSAGLFSNLNWLMGASGYIYFKVPNGLSPRFILSEGHRKIFGLAILDPDCWFHLYPKGRRYFTGLSISTNHYF